MNVVRLSDERRLALLAASARVGARLEFALEGRPAYRFLNRADGTIIPGVSTPYVRFAPPWAEDPAVLNVMLARIDNALTIGREVL